jgi:large subunit ribosomal protein L29
LRVNLFGWRRTNCRCVRSFSRDTTSPLLKEPMKIKEIVEMSMDELLTKRRDLRQESLHLRLQQQSGQLEQPSRLRLLRRDVARIETVLSQREQQTD